MRLSVQGCLILWLCLFSFLFSGPVFAAVVYSYDHSPGPSCDGIDTACMTGSYTTSSGNHYDYLYYCTEPDEVIYQSGEHVYQRGAYDLNGNYLPPRSHPAYACRVPEPCDDLTHEPGGDAASAPCGQCALTHVRVPDGPYDCALKQQPEACYENGQIYDAEFGRCVLDCPNGQLNGVCLQDTGDNADDCNADSPDYKGFIGNGSTKTNLCTSNMECEGGAFGVVNGTPACIPDEYGPPTCPSDGALVMDEYGFVCESVNDAPEEPDTPEEPNTDTDGDGQPDEYQRENDPTSVDKGLDKVQDGISDTNTKLDGTNNRLDKLGKGVDAVNDNLNEGLGTANQTLGQINDKLDGPDSGYNTDGLGDAPTFQESTERLQTSIASNPTIQAVTTIPNIASNNTCPVWTIPSTDYWQAMPIDSHCQILNDHRGLLSMLFIAVWTIAAVFVFLRA